MARLNNKKLAEKVKNENGNSNEIIFAWVTLDTNTNGTNYISHTYPANKSNMQYQQEQHESATTKTKTSN